MPIEPSTQRQQAHFDSIAGKYIEARKDPRHLLVRELIWRTFFSGTAMNLPSHPAVLEAMCGVGGGRQILEDYVGVTPDWRGFDYSPKMVAAAKAIHGEEQVFQADATAYQPERRYDLVLVIGGLHHVFRYAGITAKNLAGGLTPGGYLIAFEPTHANPLTKFIRRRIYQKNALFDDDTERDFHVRELHEILSEAGLLHRKDLHFGLSAYTLFYNPDAFPALNHGPLWLVRVLWSIDRLFAWNAIGRFFSFGTLTLWQSPRGVVSK